MGEGQVRMEPELLAITFYDAGLLPDNTAMVKASEQWNYAYYSTQSGDRVYENHVSYSLTYRLVKDTDNRWLVDDIAVEQLKQGKGEGELPFFTRPHENHAGPGKR
jgi:hypothetical protein